jgi:hypothetical protein
MEYFISGRNVFVSGFVVRLDGTTLSPIGNKCIGILKSVLFGVGSRQFCDATEQGVGLSVSSGEIFMWSCSVPGWNDSSTFERLSWSRIIV